MLVLNLIKIIGDVNIHTNNILFGLFRIKKSIQSNKIALKDQVLIFLL